MPETYTMTVAMDAGASTAGSTALTVTCPGPGIAWVHMCEAGNDPVGAMTADELAAAMDE